VAENSIFTDYSIRFRRRVHLRSFPWLQIVFS